MTGKTLLKTTDESCERTIRQYSQNEKRFNLTMKKNMTSALKLKRDHTKISSFNAIAKSRMNAKRQKALFYPLMNLIHWTTLRLWLHYDCGYITTVATL